MNQMATVERALELARSGSVRSIDDIRRTLRRERCEGTDQHLASETFKKQLRALIETRLNSSSVE